MRSHTIAGLDIGTSSIKLLVAQKKGTEWEVVACSQRPSFGLRRGSVVNVEEAARQIQMLVSGMEREANLRIDSVFVNIGGSHLYVMPSDGIISVSRADQRISEEDIDRVLQATRAVNIPSNEEILDVFPTEFIIDDQKGIKHPLGLTGVRLEAKVVLLCYFQSYFINLTQAVLAAKLQINDIVPSPLAAAEAVLTRQQRELGSALIDIGSDTTSLAVFEEGDLIHLAIFPLGSANITKDIGIGLRTEFDAAEEIKKQHGSCQASRRGKEVKLVSKSQKHFKKKIEILDRSSPLEFTEKNLTDIITPRVTEILDLMQKELKKIGRQELLPGGVVLTGGGAKLPGIRDLAKEQLKLPCEIGTIKGMVGIDQDPSLATVAGLVLGGAGAEGRSGDSILKSFGFMKGMFSRARKMFRVFIP
jgi:cell division protein FtsA